MAFPARLILSALAACALAPGLLCSQETFAGGDQPVSDSYSASCIQSQSPNIWKQLGMNPLTCHAESAPQDSRGQCSLAGMKLLSHQGSTCYYCSPMNPPANLYIPLDQVWAASQQGFSCGESVTDPNCMAVCTGSAGARYVPPVPQPPAPAPLSGQVSSGDPCHPYYDMSTAAGQAAAQTNAARDAAACNASRCQHNPQLSGCASLPDDGGTGDKGIAKIPGTTPPTGGPSTPTPSKSGPAASGEIPPVNLAAVDKAMVTCLKAAAALAYPASPQPIYRQKAQAMGPASVQSTAFGLLPNEDQIIVEAEAMALQAQALHDQKYGPSKYNPADEATFMTGYLVNCIYKGGQETAFTGKPFPFWASYVGLPKGTLQDKPISLFNQGWFWSNLGIKPSPMLPPNQQPINATGSVIGPPSIEESPTQ